MEQLQRGSNIAIIGSLMQRVHPSLVDVQALMAAQLLVEFARDFQDPSLLHNLYQYILFDMRIWARAEFHVRIGKNSPLFKFFYICLKIKEYHFHYCNLNCQ